MTSDKIISVLFLGAAALLVVGWVWWYLTHKQEANDKINRDTSSWNGAESPSEATVNQWGEDALHSEQQYQANVAEEANKWLNSH